MRKTNARASKAPSGGKTVLPHASSVGAGYGSSKPAPAALGRTRPAKTRKANTPRRAPKRRY